MSTKPTAEQLEECATEIAKKFAERLVKDYPASVKKYAAEYTELPDEADFWAWLEGYEWGES